MNQITKLKSICNRENVKLEVIKPPRYILPFILDYEEEIILIRKEGTMPAPFTPLIKVKEETPEEEFDLTGSPLHTSLDDSLINNPMNQVQMNINEYYNHSPLSFDQAMWIINHFTASGNPTFEENELPIWVLCDASDERHTILLTMWRRNDGWIMRGHAVLTSSQLFLQNLNPSLDAMLKDHLVLSRAHKNDVSYLAKACFICNKNGVSEMVDECGDNDSSLKLHFSWKRPHTHFGYPPYDALSYLEINVTVGCEGNSLWQEIEKLQEINRLMENSPAEREDQLLMTMATMNQTVMSSTVRGQVRSFVCNGKLPSSLNSYKPQGAPKNGIPHVLHIYEEIAEGKRHNMDMTEVLWSILKGCNDLVELNSCFKMVIREAASGRFTPKILPDNMTSLAKIIKGAQDILQTMSLKLRGCEALRLLWELGHLKLQRDYSYMLQRLELKSYELCDAFIGLKTSSVITKQQREEGIENLLAVHSFIETLMLFKSQLNLDNKSLLMLVTSSLQKLTSAAQDFAKSSSCRSLDCSYLDSGLQKMFFSIPVQTKFSIPLVKGCYPESWSFCLTTVKDKKQIFSIFHENNEGVFPPEINDKCDKAVSNTKENSIVNFTLLSDPQFHRDTADP